MGFDSGLADRVRGALALHGPVTERRMFGGIAFLDRGNMCCGVLNADLVLRLGNEQAKAALNQPHVRPMDFTGRRMGSMVFVSAAGCESGESLQQWVGRAAAFTASLPAKRKLARRPGSK